MVPARATQRVMSLGYSHDWLANMTEWHDDAASFYERSLGDISNGNRAQASTPSPTLRPSALYFASNIKAHPGTGVVADVGGWLEADYGKGGNLLAMTVHGRCTDLNVSTRSCAVPSDENPEVRRQALRQGCSCAKEQHYVYRWDELNRLHEARRYDRTGTGSWQIAARQRYRYDGANQRVVKQTFDVAPGPTQGTHRAALYVYGGDFERRGLEVSGDGNSWAAISGETETQYLIAGARVVWKSRGPVASLIDPAHRITYAVQNLISSTSAVIDLVSGELVEVGGFYPNGAREEQLGASDAVNGALVPLEPAGFTGKEADEEVGVTYFGERYLVSRIGRWASPDPLWIHAEGGGEALNAYHYVSGNLLQARDPLGLAQTAVDGAAESNLSTCATDACTGPAEQSEVASPKLPNDWSREKGETAKFTTEPITPAERDAPIRKVDVPKRGAQDYYRIRNDDFVRRNQGASPPSYYLEYGDKYLRAFTQLEPKLSAPGQKWLQGMRENLQLAIEDRLVADPAAFAELERNSAQFRDFAYETHPEAYLQAGLTNVPWSERLQIAAVPERKDLLNPSGISQVIETGVKLLVEDSYRFHQIQGPPASTQEAPK